MSPTEPELSDEDVLQRLIDRADSMSRRTTLGDPTREMADMAHSLGLALRETRKRIAELEGERDQWRRRAELCSAAMDRFQAERDKLAAFHAAIERASSVVTPGHANWLRKHGLKGTAFFVDDVLVALERHEQGVAQSGPVREVEAESEAAK